MLTEEERNAIVAYRLEKAINTIGQVEANIPNEFWDLIANRLYYAAYYAVTALLINDNHETHTHNGVITMFGLHYVKTGRFTKEDHRLYQRLFTQRQTGDYSDNFFLDKDDVMPQLEPTKAFIKKIADIIANNQKI